MASYTEYFYEYIENGGTLPNAFGIVPSLNGVSFENLFKKNFNAYEIALETETLFKERLEAKANIVCPFYADKISKIAGLTNIFDQTRSISRMSENTNASYLNTPDITTIGNENLASVLKDTQSENIIENVTPKGTTKIEEMSKLIELENLYQKLLDEFNSLFLFIW